MEIDCINFDDDNFSVANILGQNLSEEDQKTREIVQTLFTTSSTSTAPIFDTAAQVAILDQLVGSLSDEAKAYYDRIKTYFLSNVGKEMDEAKKWSQFYGLQSKVGALVYVAEKQPDSLSMLLTQHSPSDALHAAMKKEFHTSFETLKARANAAIENGDLFLSHAIPEEIGNALITSGGQLNLGIIPSLKTTFLPGPISNWEQRTRDLLDQMNPSWQPVIDSIVKPLDPASPSNTLIQIEQRVFPGATITDIHAKKTALGALLSPPIACRVHCDTTAWQAKKHLEHPLEALKNFQAILQFGYLTHSVANSTQYLFYLAENPEEVLLKSLSLTNLKGPFWKSPNIISGCLAMGIERPDKLASAVLQTLPKTAEDILRAYAALVNPANAEATFALGKYGFTEANNRLQLAVMSAFMALSEVRRDAPIRKNLLQSVQSALAGHWAVRSVRGLVATEMSTTFQDLLNNRIRFVYNATMKNFDLYEMDLQNPSQIGDPIQTSAQFQDFISRVVRLTGDTLLRGTQNQHRQRAIHATVIAVVNFVNTDQFASGFRD